MAYIKTRVRELMSRKQRISGESVTLESLAESTELSYSSVQGWSANRINRFDGKQMAAFLIEFDCTFNDLFVLVLEKGDVLPEGIPPEMVEYDEGYESPPETKSPLLATA